MDIRSVPGPGPPASASAAGLCSERRLAFDFDFNGYCFVLNVPFLDASRILDLTIYLETTPDPLRMHLWRISYAPGSDVYSSQGHQTGIGQGKALFSLPHFQVH